MSRPLSRWSRTFRPRLDRLEGREVPAIFTVTTASDDPLDVGTTLREALTLANNALGADEIRFALPAGSTITVDPAAGGSFGGPQGPLPFIANPLTLTGPGKDALTVSGGGAVRVFDIASDAVTVSMSGLTIADGKLTNNSQPAGPQAGFGAGIRNAAALTLTDVRLRNNATQGVAGKGGVTSSGDGTAVYTTGPLTVTGSEFADNTGTVADGAAIFAQGAKLTVANSTFLRNAVTVGSGGAIFVADADLTVTGSTFTGNTAELDGGAVAGGNLTAPRSFAISDTVFDGNVAQDRGGAIDVAARVTLAGTRLIVTNNRANAGGVPANGLGGGLFVEGGGSADLTDLTLTGNTAGNSGGGVFAAGRLTVTGGLVRANGATNDGGGLFLGDATADSYRLVNVTVVENSAGRNGGGVAAVATTSGAIQIVVVSGATFLRNTAGGAGGGLHYATAAGQGAFGLANSVVALNTAPAGPDLFGSWGRRGNVIGSLSGATFVAGSNPVTGFNLTQFASQIGPVADNGGPTQTVALLAGNPAFGAGDSTALSDLPATDPGVVNLLTDQRGRPRPAAAGRYDAGAFQAQRPTAVNDAFTIAAGGTTIPAAGVLTNDTLADVFTAKTAVLVQDVQAGAGTLTLNADGSFRFVPASGVSGPVTFTYAVSDGASTSAPATVTLTTGIVLTLTAADKSYGPVAAGATLAVPAATGLLAGVASPSGGTVRVVNAVAAVGTGILTVAADGGFTFAAAAGTVGTATFTYQLTDGIAPPSNTGTVTITVTAGVLAASTRFTVYGTGAGVRAQVRVVRPGQTTLDLRPFEDSFTGGARVAVADVNRDGVDDVVVGAGPGGGPRVTVYDGKTGGQIANFFGFESSFRGGAHVAAADAVRTGADGQQARTSLLVVGAGSYSDQPGTPRVRAFKDFSGLPTDPASQGTAAVDFIDYDPKFQGGVRVAAGDLDGDGTIELVTIAGPSGGPDLRVYDTGTLTGTVPLRRQQFNGLGVGSEGYRGGAFVAVTNGAVVVTPDSIPDISNTELQAQSGTLADTAGVAAPGSIVAGTTSRPPAVYVFLPAGGGRVNPAALGFDLGEPGRPTFLGGVRVTAGATPGGGAGAAVLIGYGTGGRGRVRQFAFNPAAGVTGVAQVLDRTTETSSQPFGDLGPDVSIYVGVAPLPFVRTASGGGSSGTGGGS